MVQVLNVVCECLDPAEESSNRIIQEHQHHSKIIWGILYQDTSIWGKSFPPNGGGLIPTGVPRPEHGEAPGERGRALCKPLSQLKSLGT